jgi:hypothetical protein
MTKHQKPRTYQSNLDILDWRASEGPKRVLILPCHEIPTDNNDDKDKDATQSFKKAHMGAIPHPPAINKTGTRASDGKRNVGCNQTPPTM